jgi:hypothetical protein
LSVVSFAIGYRRAVSARRERARAAEDDLSKTLLKRVIVDGYRPSTTELGYLLQSKVRQQKVKLGDLPTELQIMQRLYSEVLETEFIARKQREQLLVDVDEVISHERKAAASAAERVVAASDDRAQTRNLAGGILASVIAGLAVTAVAVVGESSGDTSTWLAAGFAIVAASVGAYFGIVGASRSVTLEATADPLLVTFQGYVGDTTSSPDGRKWLILYLDNALSSWLVVQADAVVERQRLVDEPAPFGHRDIIWVTPDATVVRGTGEVAGALLNGPFVRAQDITVGAVP